MTEDEASISLFNLFYRGKGIARLGVNTVYNENEDCTVDQTLKYICHQCMLPPFLRPSFKIESFINKNGLSGPASNSLEFVQRFASKSWSSNYSSFLTSFKIPTLLH